MHGEQEKENLFRNSVDQEGATSLLPHPTDHTIKKKKSNGPHVQIVSDMHDKLSLGQLVEAPAACIRACPE